MLRYATGQEFVLWSQYLLISVVSVDATLLHEMDNTANSFLTPSSYSASSALDNYGANQASGSVFDSKGDDNPRAWCPQSPIQDDRREWLQLDFDGLKVIKLLITWGLSSKPAHFVPYFLLLYQRHDGRWHQFTSHNGTQARLTCLTLIVANQDNSQPKTITLSPPITARRLRIVPYRGDHAQLMCLKLSVLGHAFEASILSYEIPEGDIYRSPAGGVTWAALNDSSYDGNRSPKRTSLLAGGSHRGLLAGGLGVLVDGRIYAGGEIRRALEAPFSLRNMPRDSRQTLSGLVGWFCRSGLPPSLLSPPCQSRNVSLLFAFESVRHFTELRIHALNSFSENIAVFREALVQFSVGGRLFDRYGPPVLYEYQRNVTSSQPTWVVIPLNGRVGRFVRLILTFDSDWIILSEVAFNSTLLTANIDEEEKGVLSQSPITPLPSPKRHRFPNCHIANFRWTLLVTSNKPPAKSWDPVWLWNHLEPLAVFTIKLSRRKQVLAAVALCGTESGSRVVTIAAAAAAAATAANNPHTYPFVASDDKIDTPQCSSLSCDGIKRRSSCGVWWGGEGWRNRVDSSDLLSVRHTQLDHSLVTFRSLPHEPWDNLSRLAPTFGAPVAVFANRSQQLGGALSPPQARSPSGDETADLSLIISAVCVVGLILIVSVFVYVLCRLCRGGCRGNQALTGKASAADRSTDSGGHKPKLLDGGNGVLPASGDGRFLAFGGGTSTTNAYCLANTMAANDIPPSSKSADMYSPFNANGKLGLLVLTSF
ncbi:unnamed protein product [Mesocestoides corti]|uniref:F5/8 type C domain-containing protein n=1 Tax=Mesocestoides corti TaxID=53468 RepID=A0A158QS57_MESCO|nr:unnamed protein product [Mesocestoides corti]